MSHHPLFPVLTLAAAFAVGGCSMMPGTSSEPAKATDGMLTGAGGMTLYTFDRDAPGNGKSVCNGACAANWPPLMAAKGATGKGPWSLVTREDGTMQWAYQGRPLYYWAKDQKPGDKTGDGFNNAWHIVRP